MGSEYWLAWLALYGFGLVFIGLCVYVIRRFFYLALLVGGMGILWMLIPIPSESGIYAPLYVVLLFQMFFEPDASYAFAATAAILGSGTVVAAVMLVYAFNSLLLRDRVFDFFRAKRMSIESKFKSKPESD